MYSSNLYYIWYVIVHNVVAKIKIRLTKYDVENDVGKNTPRVAALMLRSELRMILDTATLKKCDIYYISK